MKLAAKVALAALVVIVGLAAVFFKERVLFADSSYAVYTMIDQTTIFVFNQRYGSFIARLIPYGLLKMHMPLASIILGYGIDGSLFLLVITALMVFYYRQYRFAILIACYSMLVVSDSFFMLADTPVGIGWMFLFFAAIIRLGRKNAGVFTVVVPFIVFSFLAVTTHFVVIIPTLFLWVYLILDKDMWPFSSRRTVVFSLLLLLILAVKFRLTSSQSSDSGQLHGITHLNLQDIINSFTSPTVAVFLYRCMINYWALVIIFIIGIISLARERKIKALTWSVISVAGYLSLMSITYADLDDKTLLCHIELEWQALGLIASVPFVFSALPKFKPAVAVCALTAIFISRFVYIGNSLSVLEYRYQYTKHIMAQMKKKGITKLTLCEDANLNTIYQLTWAVNYESLLASAMDNDEPQLTFCVARTEAEHLFGVTQDPKAFWTLFGAIPADHMDHRYFNIDTTHAYTVMTTEELFK